MTGSVYPYDPCRDPATGRRYKPGDCPKWSTSHRRWGLVVDLGLRYDENKGRNVRQQLRREGFDRKVDAERALEDELPAIRVGIAPSLADRKLTVSDWCDRWLASKASIRPSTRAGYASIVALYIKPAIGHVPLLQLRADHLDAMLGLMRSGQLRPAVNRRRPDALLAASTIRQVFAVTATMLNAAVKRRLLPYSPAAGVELEPVEHRDKRAWNGAEIAAFLAVAEREEPRLAIGYRIALSYGLRRGELAGLRWQDIDTDAGWLHVRQNIPAVGNLEPGLPKTTAGLRSIPLGVDDGFPAALREHRKRQLADRLAAGAGWTDTGLVLADDRGGLVKPWDLTNTFRALVAAAGLPVITLHGCRRCANSLWARAGIDVQTRMEWGGWSDPSMADVRYMKVTEEAHGAAARQVAAFRAANGLS